MNNTYIPTAPGLLAPAIISLSTGRLLTGEVNYIEDYKTLKKNTFNQRLYDYHLIFSSHKFWCHYSNKERS